MSQHYFNTLCQDHRVRVLLGWEHKLQYFFLVVHAMDLETEETTSVDENGNLYCNLDDEAVPEDVALQSPYFRRRLDIREAVYQPDGARREAATKLWE